MHCRSRTEFETVMKLIEIRDQSCDKEDQLSACKRFVDYAEG